MINLQEIQTAISASAIVQAYEQNVGCKVSANTYKRDGVSPEIKFTFAEHREDAVFRYQVANGLYRISASDDDQRFYAYVPDYTDATTSRDIIDQLETQLSKVNIHAVEQQIQKK